MQEFPEGERRTQISMNGGDDPLWAPDGRELFYRSDGKVMAVLHGETKTQASAHPSRRLSDVGLAQRTISNARFLFLPKRNTA